MSKTEKKVKTLNVKWVPSNEECEIAVPPPVPASKAMPEWYTSKTPVNANNFALHETSGLPIRSLRNCMPFHDALSAGWIQESWTDIYIGDTNGQGTFFSPTQHPEFVEVREIPNIDAFTNCLPIEFAWVTPWMPSLPKGWSILFCHPLNRFDLPFYTTSGIVDVDVFCQASGRMPFYVKAPAPGIIPAGTPLYQMIPIKRSFWKSKISKFDRARYLKNDMASRRLIISSYARTFWQPKRYR